MVGYDDICCFSGHQNSSKIRVLWEITNRCNLNCEFCHRTKNKCNECSFEEAVHILSLFQRSGVTKIIFSGGEPFCRPDMLEIMSKAKEYDFEIDMCTNGTLLNPNRINALSNLLTEISISIDSHLDSIHDKSRCFSGAWKATVANVKQLIKIGLEVHVISILNEETLPYISETVAFLYDLGVHSVSFIGEIPVGSGYNPLLESATQSYLREVFDTLRCQYSLFPINTKQVFADCKPNCVAGIRTFGLNCEGILYPCILRRNVKGIDIHHATPDEIHKAFSGSFKWPIIFQESGQGVCVGSRVINTYAGDTHETQ